MQQVREHDLPEDERRHLRVWLVMQQRVKRMFLGLAAALGAVLIHPEGEAGHGFRYDPDASVDGGEMDRRLRGDRLAGTTGAEVEGRGCADGVLGLVASEEETGERILHYCLLFFM